MRLWRSIMRLLASNRVRGSTDELVRRSPYCAAFADTRHVGLPYTRPGSVDAGVVKHLGVAGNGGVHGDVGSYLTPGRCRRSRVAIVVKVLFVLSVSARRATWWHG